MMKLDVEIREIGDKWVKFGYNEYIQAKCCKFYTLMIKNGAM